MKIINKSLILLTIALASLSFVKQASADVQIIHAWQDKTASITVVGNASKMGFTQGFGKYVPYDKAFKIILPDWKIFNRVGHWPKKYVSWTQGTLKIEILKEMARTTGLFFYVDQKHKNITIEKRN